MSRSSLLVVTTSYPQAGDGSEAAGAFVADFVLSASRHVPVRVVAPGARETVEEASPGVYVHRYASPGRPLSLLSPSRPGDWPAILATLRSLRRQVLAAGREGCPAHTLALWALPSGWAARNLARARAVPYSVWVLGSDIWTLGRIPGVRWMLRGVIRDARYRFADGLQLADQAGALSGRPFDFLPSSRRLATRRLRPLAEGPPYRLLFLGRWHPNKGIDLLLQALHSLPEGTWAQIGEVHIAGGGPLDGLVREQVAMLKAAGRPVRLDGFLDTATATQALHAADYLLLPSRVESIPVVFSDAMKSGLPVVSMPVGDLPALLSGGGVGMLAGAASFEAFACAITAALGRPPALDAESMQAMAGRFDTDECVTSVLKRLGLLPTQACTSAPGTGASS